ncbi:MAG TPA: FkbM family methyltransferase [Bryobacteraceae bacterium]|nr:FkbM family methyltransferase [Bryobacteraceae bacterium]
MSLKLALKRALLRYGYCIRHVPSGGVTGSDPFEDKHRLTCSPCPVVFDIGANIGQTMQQFRRYFKTPEIHSFEPGEDAFQKLTKNTIGLGGVHIVNSGMGARRETKTFGENQESVMSSFLEPGEDAWGSVVTRRALQLDTVDDYCERSNIGHIDILKSDTQGYDLEVLRGASRMLSEGNVSLVYLEVTFSKMYRGSPRFDELYGFLADHGMTLVSFYEMHYQRDSLSWTDALFTNGRRGSNNGRPVAS